MADYLFLVMEDEGAHASESAAAIAEMIARRQKFADALRGAGQLRDHGRFRPSKEGKRVRRDSARLVIDDGPFAGNALAAYYWVSAPSLDAARQLAAACPTLPTDDIDVRPLMKGATAPDKLGKPGKIFAFAVLGTAASEDAWVGVMDRIDAETHDRFPAASFLGGNRLQPPKRATFDGPFLESKEVIGGVFFLRMMTIDDAVAWAAESRFVVHGALEIRELWRS
jgi:hypothetical protein